VRGDIRMTRLATWLARQKQIFCYGYSCVGVIGIAYLVASKVRDDIASMGIHISMIYLLPAGVFGLWLIGWIAFKVGVYGAEQAFTWEHNPNYQKLRNKHDA